MPGQGLLLRPRRQAAGQQLFPSESFLPNPGLSLRSRQRQKPRARRGLSRNGQCPAALCEATNATRSKGQGGVNRRCFCFSQAESPKCGPQTSFPPWLCRVTAKPNVSGKSETLEDSLCQGVQQKRRQKPRWLLRTEKFASCKCLRGLRKRRPRKSRVSVVNLHRYPRLLQQRAGSESDQHVAVYKRATYTCVYIYNILIALVWPNRRSTHHWPLIR